MQTVLKNARIVTPDAIIDGSLGLDNGQITDISGSTQIESAIDCEGDWVVPGLVDLHTDNLEKHYQPRPNVTWDPVGAAMAHDAQMAAAGITTVFDSLAVSGEKNGFDRGEHLVSMLDGVKTAQDHAMLRVDHKLHLRCEISRAKLPETLSRLEDHDLLGLISIMDHTPGQRQYRHMAAEQMVELARAHGMTDKDIAKMKADFDNRDLSMLDDNRDYVVELVKRKALPLATHDDETEDHVQEGLENGATLSEFPVTIKAAELAKQARMAIIMGAPNLIRGGSHSGNIAASDLAQRDMLDVLASDYLPSALLRAAFMLTEEPVGWSLPKAINTVTLNPARAARLNDRGSIETGKRADLVRVRQNQETGWTQILSVWREGRRVV